MAATETSAARHSRLEVVRVALRLGLTSFGGPIAHLGYFHDEYVVRRRWLGERAYPDLVALCQVLPGPASSQVGISIGMLRAGLLGGVAAWVGFTLPSAIALVAFAYGIDAFDLSDAGFVRGLKLAAVAVVAVAVWTMAGRFASGRVRGSIAVAAALAMLAWQHPVAQLAVIAGGAVVGALVLRHGRRRQRRSRRPGAVTPRAAGCDRGGHDLRRSARRPTGARAGDRRGRHRDRRRLLSHWLAGVRWRTRGASADRARGGAGRLDLGGRLPRRLRSCAGGAGAALLVLGLPRRVVRGCSRRRRGRVRWHSLRSISRASCCSSPCSPSGRGCAATSGRARPSRSSAPPSSACWPPRCTSRCGPAQSSANGSSASRSWRSACSSSGARRSWIAVLAAAAGGQALL